MSTREKVILSLVAIAALYAAADHFLLSSRPATPSPSAGGTARLQARTAKAMTALGQTALSPEEDRILDLAESSWPTDPLLQTRLNLTPEVAQRAYRYSGYVAAGDAAWAIIDGVEYRPGDELESGECVVETITDRHVILRSKTDPDARMTVPLEEQPLGVRARGL